MPGDSDKKLKGKIKNAEAALPRLLNGLGMMDERRRDAKEVLSCEFFVLSYLTVITSCFFVPCVRL